MNINTILVCIGTSHCVFTDVPQFASPPQSINVKGLHYESYNYPYRHRTSCCNVVYYNDDPYL